MRYDVVCTIVISPGGVRVIACNECGAAVRLAVSGTSARQNVTV